MSLERPSLSEIYERMITDVETKFTDIGSLLRRSVLRVLIKVFAGAVHLLYGYIVLMANQVFASTATTEYLDKIGSEYGLYRNPAEGATGVCQATGTDGITIPAGTELQSASGYLFSVDEDVTIASGVANLAITAKTAGADSNDEAGVVLAFTSPILGVSSSATVDSEGLSGGADQEIDDDYRVRVLTRKQFPPHGGCENDYVVWSKEVSGVTRAWCFPNYIGLGTIAVAFVRDDDTTIIPNSSQREIVRNYLIEHIDPGSGQTVGAPVTMSNSINILELTELSVNLTIALYPNTVAVRTAVQNEIEELLLTDGGPGQILRLSRISEAISNASGEEYHSIVSPVVDIPASFTEIHTLGTITFQEYV